MDSHVVFCAGQDGVLMKLMTSIPPNEWKSYFLHDACVNNKNLDAIRALLNIGFNINVYNSSGRTPVLTACNYSATRALEYLVAAGADLSVRDLYGRGPLELAFSATIYWKRKDPFVCVRFLLANGLRLSNLMETWQHNDYPEVHMTKSQWITPELVDFERGVLSCRLATVAFLRVKRAGKLWQWDKFLLAFIARQVWATRTEEEWRV